MTHSSCEPTIIDQRLLTAATALAVRAGKVILAARAAGVSARMKDDQSPVTAADQASEEILVEGLGGLLPGVPIVSEEQPKRAAIGDSPALLVLVDPLDGTREFLAGRDEFTVNVGFVAGGTPVAGIVAAPARGLIWRGIVGHGAERLSLSGGGAAETIRTRALGDAAHPVAVVSRSHLDAATSAFLDRAGVAAREPCGSALKFCLLAQGSADLYARLAPTCAWDIAAGHAVLAAAGGVMTRPNLAPLSYAALDASFRIQAFLACGDPSALHRFRSEM